MGAAIPRAQSLYERWAMAGAAMIIGEVQGSPHFAEKPGNLVLRADSHFANRCLADPSANPAFPKFSSPQEGGITAWYTMRLTQLGQDRDANESLDLDTTVKIYTARDKERIALWNDRFRA